MRTQEEIQEHMAALAIAITRPCNCRNNGHDFQCRRGGELMASALKALEWVMEKEEQWYTGLVVALVESTK